MVILLVLGWFAAMVQRQPFRTSARDADRAVIDDLRQQRTEWAIASDTATDVPGNDAGDGSLWSERRLPRMGVSELA